MSYIVLVQNGKVWKEETESSAYSESEISRIIGSAKWGEASGMEELRKKGIAGMAMTAEEAEASEDAPMELLFVNSKGILLASVNGPVLFAAASEGSSPEYYPLSNKQLETVESMLSVTRVYGVPYIVYKVPDRKSRAKDILALKQKVREGWPAGNPKERKGDTDQ